MSSLTDSILANYPGAYDHLDPADIERAVIGKYPGAYDHLTEHLDDTKQVAQDDSKKPGMLDEAISFLKNAASKTGQFMDSPLLPERSGGDNTTTYPFPASVPVLGNIGIPSFGAAYDSLREQSSPMNIAAMALPGLAHRIASGAPQEMPQQTPQELPNVTLPPEFTAVGEEPAYNRPQQPGMSEQTIFNLARDKFNMGRDLPSDIQLPSMNEARQGLMSEVGGLGSGEQPPIDSGKTENYLQAEQFFKDQGKNPLALSPKATDVKFDEKSGTFIPTDTTGKQVGLPVNTEGDLPKPSVLAESKYFKEEDLPKSPPKPRDNTDFLTKTADAFSKTAKSVLGMHVPGTAFSMHGINETMRHTLFGGDQSFTGMPGRAGEALYSLINPKSANRALEQIPTGDLSNAVNKHGLQMDISDVDVPSLFKGNNIATKAFNFITDPTPLFRQVIPNLKFKTYKNVMDNLVSKGIDENKAGTTAADYANTVYGGVTPNGLRADPTFTKLSRIAALAPDWMTSNYRLGAGTGKALMNPTDPRGQMYMKGMMNFMGAYAAANVFNKMNTGHFMFENEPGKELSVVTGKDSDGRVRYADPFGTAMDFVRIPMAIAHSSLSGPSSGFKESMQLMKNRASEPLQLLGSLAFNQDYSGRPLYGKTNFGRKTIPEGDAAQNIGTETASHILPIGIDALLDRMRGKISDEEAAAKFFQLPMSYKKPAKGYR